MIRDELSPVQKFEVVWNSLTEEERIILEARCDGRDMTDISNELDLAVSTTSAKARVIYEKMEDFFEYPQSRSMEFVCMRFGYERALQDVMQVATGRKRRGNPSG